MKIAFFGKESGEKAAIEQQLSDHEVLVIEKPLESEFVPDSAKDVQIVSVFMDSTIDAPVLDKLPNLKLVTTRGTGFDHINVEECRKRGIVVSNVPSYGDNTVAEHAFALILALSRKLYLAYERTEHANFDRDGLRGFDLRGKTLGVIGAGNIGCNAARIGVGFGMNVIAFDTRKDDQRAKENGFSYVSTLNELLEKSDVITIHVPYMSSTHHLINKENIKNIKSGAILVNTARGGVVDTEALLWALEEKILAGAGLDVLEEEEDIHEDISLLSKGFPKGKDIATLLRNHMLIARQDVIITPHNAFNSREALERIFETTIQNIQAFTKGNPINIVS